MADEALKEFASPFDPPSGWVDDAKFYKQLLPDGIEVNCIVELGVHFGYSLFTFARDFPDAAVFGIDNFSYHDSALAEHHLKRYLPQFANAKIMKGGTVETAKLWAQPDMFLDIDILHIDAGHKFDEAKADFDAWSKFVTPGGVVLFHDVESQFEELSVVEFFDQLEGNKKKLGNLGAWYKDD